MTNARHGLNLHHFATPSIAPGGDILFGQAYVSYKICGPAECALHTAVSNGDLKGVDTALSHDIDVDHIILDFTPLAIAALDRDEDMMLTLLSHNADPQLAYVLLKQKGIVHPGAFAALLGCAEVSPRLEEAIGRLKDDFLHELDAIDDKVAVARHEYSRLLVIASKNAQHHQHQQKSFSQLIDEIKCVSVSWSITINRKPEIAWHKCLTLLRNLMRGQVPSTVGEVLLLLVLARAMTPQVAGMDQDSIKAELERDMSRWHGLFKDDWAKSQSFQGAVKTLFSVNLSEPMLNPISGLNEALCTLQPLAERLVRQVHRHLGQRHLGHGVVLFVAHARCLPGPIDGDADIVHEGTAVPNHVQHQMSNQDHPLRHDRHRQGHRAPRNHAYIAPHANTNCRAATVSSTFARAVNFQSQLVLLLAGVVFNIIVAFLSVVRSILHSPTADYKSYDCDVGEPMTPIAIPPISIDCPWLPLVICRTATLLRQYIHDGSRPCARCSEISPLRAQRRRRCHLARNAPVIPQAQSDPVEQNGQDGIVRASEPATKIKKTYCEICQRDYKNTPNYGKHYREKHLGIRFHCEESGCDCSYVRRTQLAKHIKARHPNSSQIVNIRHHRTARQRLLPGTQLGSTVDMMDCS